MDKFEKAIIAVSLIVIAIVTGMIVSGMTAPHQETSLQTPAPAPVPAVAVTETPCERCLQNSDEIEFVPWITEDPPGRRVSSMTNETSATTPQITYDPAMDPTGVLYSGRV